jgi:hypothetical protein
VNAFFCTAELYVLLCTLKYSYIVSVSSPTLYCIVYDNERTCLLRDTYVCCNTSLCSHATHSYGGVISLLYLILGVKAIMMKTQQQMMMYSLIFTYQICRWLMTKKMKLNYCNNLKNSSSSLVTRLSLRY